MGAGVRVRIRRFGKRQDIYQPSSLCWWLMPGTARPSGWTPTASPPSPYQQVPYPGKSAFYARPSNVPPQARLPFGPSPCKQVSLLALDGRYAIDYFGLC